MSVKYRGLFEYEYPSKHQPPAEIDIHINDECVKGKIIEWEYRPISSNNQNQAASQKSKFDKMKAEIENCEDKIRADGIYDKSQYTAYTDALNDVLMIVDKYESKE